MSEPDNRNYYELLRDPRWQRKRLEILQRDKWACVHCGEDKVNLQVDHKRYRKGHKPWEYEDDELETLCERCHKTATVQRKALYDAMPLLAVSDIERVRGYVQGLSLCLEVGYVVVESWSHGMGIADALGLEEDQLFSMLHEGNRLDMESAADLGNDNRRKSHRKYHKQKKATK